MRKPAVRSLLLAAALLTWPAGAGRDPSEAAAVVEALIGGRPAPSPAPPSRRATVPADGLPVFVSEVRLVSLAVSVTDARGLPFPGLRRDEFVVLENGAAQTIAAASAGEIPFNLAILLDLSGSTIRDRETMREAARRFIGVARAQDRVALYAIAEDEFRVLAPLTTDRRRLLEVADRIPDLKGSTPLYASIALAWNEELAARPTERNAIITISDGLDDSLEGRPGPVAFSRLRRAARAMPAALYPVHLDSRNIHYGERAFGQMRALAAETGGRVFVAQSLEDLEPVYEQLVRELRSVYTLAYYPKDQNFDGRWRKIEVRVKHAGLRVRTRQGYFAR